MRLPSNIMTKSTITVRRRCSSSLAPTKAGKAHWSVVGQRHALSHGVGVFPKHIAGILWWSSAFLNICYFICTSFLISSSGLASTLAGRQLTVYEVLQVSTAFARADILEVKEKTPPPQARPRWELHPKPMDHR